MTDSHQVLCRHGYVVDTKKVTAKKLAKVKKTLTVQPKQCAEFKDESEAYPVYKENGRFMYLPKFYGISEFGPPKKIVGMESARIRIKFKTKLREYQVPIAKECIELLKKHMGGIISLPCGAGKTVLGIYLAHMLGLKALVVVHKTFLQNQWYDRLKEFTDARIGIIRQNKTDVEDKDVVIGMLQSICLRDYGPEVFSDFGVVIYDECHHLAAKMFSNSLYTTCCPFTIGLSATPQRGDGLMKVIKWHIGDIIYKMTRKANKNVMVNIFKYKSTDKKKFAEKKRWMKGKIRVSTQSMLTNITEIDDRNDFIVDIINVLRNHDDRKILILSARLKHLETMKDKIDQIIKKDEEDGKLEEDEVRTSYYVGGMKEYKLKDSAECDIIFATDAMAEEGLDIASLNTIILTTPKKNIEQAIGRIMRKQLQAGDILPVIIDVADQLSVFRTQGNTRNDYYNKNKYSIVTSYVENRTLVPNPNEALQCFDADELALIAEDIGDDGKEELNLDKLLQNSLTEVFE